MEKIQGKNAAQVRQEEEEACKSFGVSPYASFAFATIEPEPIEWTEEDETDFQYWLMHIPGFDTQEVH